MCKESGICSDRSLNQTNMLTLGLPFRITVKTPITSLRNGLAGMARQESAAVILEELLISIQAGPRIYQVSSNHTFKDGRESSYGRAWPRWLWQLGDGIWIEQQLAVPTDGNALAISWRSIGQPHVPCCLKVSPVFSAAEPFTEAGFRFEPETHGQRLTWQPFAQASKIIADTNGRCDSIRSLSDSRLPAAFEFNLSSRPAVLIFSSEFPRLPGTDSLIGGFLARLGADPSANTEPYYLRNLTAA